MKKYSFGFFLIVLSIFSCGDSIKKKDLRLPQEVWGDFFDQAISLPEVKSDQHFANAEAKGQPSEILAYFQQEKEKGNFNLSRFIDSTFSLAKNETFQADPSKVPFEEFVRRSFLSLVKSKKNDNNTLVPTRKNYISGGGYHDHSEYWHQFFVYKGFQKMGKVDLSNAIVLNTMQFLQDYGYVPAGNRSYLMSETQLPIACLLVEEHTIKNPDKLAEYGSLLTKEYQYWMQAEKQANLKAQKSYKTGVLIDNITLNRYFANDSLPRIGHYIQDKKQNKKTLHLYRTQDMVVPYIDNRFDDIYATIPVDLNAVLFKLETLLSKAYQKKDKAQYAESFKNLAEIRKRAFLKYGTTRGLPVDFNSNTKSPNAITLASVWSLYTGMYDEKQADKAWAELKTLLSKNGLFQNSSTDGHQSTELNYVAFLVAEKLRDNVVANQLREAIVSKYKQEYISTGQVNSQGKERIDSVFGVLNALL
ncbi:MAG: trehalase family glycosidase [Leadbetterella sp.]